jgi:hypothetical protein
MIANLYTLHGLDVKIRGADAHHPSSYLERTESERREDTIGVRGARWEHG